MRIKIFFACIYFVASYPMKALDSPFELNFNNSLENYAIRCLLDFASKVSLINQLLDEIQACQCGLNAAKFRNFYF